jgi:hypothetical protein
MSLIPSYVVLIFNEENDDYVLCSLPIFDPSVLVLFIFSYLLTFFFFPKSLVQSGRRGGGGGFELEKEYTVYCILYIIATSEAFFSVFE